MSSLCPFALWSKRISQFDLWASRLLFNFAIYPWGFFFFLTIIYFISKIAHLLDLLLFQGYSNLSKYILWQSFYVLVFNHLFYLFYFLRCYQGVCVCVYVCVCVCVCV